MDSPLPSFSRIRSTVMRVPTTTGLPIITFGSETISNSLIVPLPDPDSIRAPTSSASHADGANASAQRPDASIASVRSVGARCWAAVVGSFDDLICSHSQRWWNRQSDGPRGLHVDDQFELGGLLNRKIARPSSLQNPVNEFCRLAEVLSPTRSVRHQGTFARSPVFSIHRRQTALRSKLHDPGTELNVEWARNDHGGVDALSARVSERMREVVGCTYCDRDDDDFKIGGYAFQRIQLLAVGYIVRV